jgi:hypothetical protein
MDSLDLLAFAGLFREAFLKCFGYPLKDPLTETESKLFYNKIFEQTGLTVGWKSIKNYSFFIVTDAPGKQENPSVATLDTLSRYVLGAPYITEPERKKHEPHYPYWFRYKEQFVRRQADGAGMQGDGVGTGGAGHSGVGAEGIQGDEGGRDDRAGIGEKGVVIRSGGKGGIVTRKFIGGKRRGRMVLVTGALFVLLTGSLVFFFRRPEPGDFSEDFHAVGEDSLAVRGWWVDAKSPTWWGRRGERPGGLTLFTLPGDYWPDAAHTPVIRDLLLRKLPCDCFTLEIHLKNFIPRQNWQQAGILLLEDTALTGKSVRITIAYNDYNGGYPRSRSILIQAITSLGNGSGKPEEIAHIPLFNVDSLDSNPALARNLENAALRIERRGSKFRFLYSDGVMENTSFKEAVTHEFPMTPRYAGIFALKGFVEDAENMPVLFTYFGYHCDRCSP